MGAALPHLKDLQGPIRMTIDEMDLDSVGHSSSDNDLQYSIDDPSDPQEDEDHSSQLDDEDSAEVQ